MQARLPPAQQAAEGAQLCNEVITSPDENKSTSGITTAAAATRQASLVAKQGRPGVFVIDLQRERVSLLTCRSTEGTYKVEARRPGVTYHHRGSGGTVVAKEPPGRRR
jgi:hypothetical protein